MSSLKVLCLLITGLSVSACSLTDPFIDRRRNAGAKDAQHLYVGQSQPDKPVICYNSLRTNAEELQSMADEACRQNQSGTHALRTDTASFSCRLFLPSRAYYQCTPNDEDEK